MTTLKTRDILALGFMTFALFLGAGNIIFPPSVGLAAGEFQWSAALGFLLTGVGLPLLGVVALARVGGGLDTLTSPIGKLAGTLMGLSIYLTIGPFFATPRTATVSFEVGMAPFTGNTPEALLLFTIGYFALVMVLSLFPGKLMDNIGKIITPALIVVLSILGIAAFMAPAGDIVTTPAHDYASASQALAQGFLQGYQTMDALASLVFGIIIVAAIKAAGVTDTRLHTRYTILAGLIAATGLGLVYVSLVYLGAMSGSVVEAGASGVKILNTYVDNTFGTAGSFLLAAVILLACLTTGVGLVSSCSAYFSELLGVKYRTVVIVMSVFSTAVANQGLEQLITVAVPVLVAIYPVAMALIALGLMSKLFRHKARVFIPVMGVALVFGIVDAIKAAGFGSLIPAALDSLPGSALGLGWLLPVAATLALSTLLDRMRPAPATTTA
ncbi:branched-chain amino acid transport system II carrier protein [Comamonas aquatica]|uniref:branched-chain amino acid transport system II carrier protein n=1 Tax=Comamonas aquatica TaxID=225991 RepID=UPI002447268B|nr:branched-chain amino acid transport system II carrier protein [Comamonas aquatica]MDH1813263.1 branched-chain amino acid transport system II carrier protein [Comamonas aquatica]